jgi:hypothetical protein
LDFESKILVKENAPELLRKELSSPKWKPQTLAMSGVTDCYQPIERHHRITRRIHTNDKCKQRDDDDAQPRQPEHHPIFRLSWGEDNAESLEKRLEESRPAWDKQGPAERRLRTLQIVDGR